MAKEMLVLLLICPISSLQFDKRPPRVPILTVRRNLITSHALLGTTLSAYLAGLCLENGLFLAAISLTYGMPLIVELGVLFDVLVAVMVLGILVYRIRETFESMDVSRLRRLRG